METCPESYHSCCVLHVKREDVVIKSIGTRIVLWKTMFYIARNMEKLLCLCMIDMGSTSSTSRVFDIYFILVYVSL